MFNQYPIGVLTIQHPDNGTMTIAEVIRTYAWHGKHHIAHITTLRKQKNWQPANPKENLSDYKTREYNKSEMKNGNGRLF